MRVSAKRIYPKGIKGNKGEQMMKVIQAFFRKYSITILVYIGIIALYAFVANNRLINAFLFPTTTAICKAFLGDLNVMRLNLIASLSILTPAILISLILALVIGLHPAFSLCPFTGTELSYGFPLSDCLRKHLVHGFWNHHRNHDHRQALSGQSGCTEA